MGDPIFDAYYASNIQFQASAPIQERKMQIAGISLLQKIGQSILVSHSQGGLMPWVITDAVPHLVKAIISIEPTGPPFREAIFSSTPSRPYGLTNIPLTYSPAPTNASMPLETEVVENDKEGLETCVLQKEPARQLVNFKGVKVLIVTSQASYHAPYDGCTVRFLKQARVDVDWLRLEDVGVLGNGHLCFMERNSDDIAGVLEGRIKEMVG